MTESGASMEEDRYGHFCSIAGKLVDKIRKAESRYNLRYALLVSCPSDSKNGSLFNGGLARAAFQWGPKKNVWDSKVHGILSDLPELIMAYWFAVRHKNETTGVNYLISLWERLGANYGITTVPILGSRIREESDRLNYADPISIKRHAQDTGNNPTISVGRSCLTLEDGLSLCYQATFNSGGRGLVLGLGNFNEIKDILSFSDVPARAGKENKAHEKRLGGNRILVAQPGGTVDVLSLDRKVIGSFSNYEWGDFIRILGVVGDKYENYVKSLVN